MIFSLFDSALEVEDARVQPESFSWISARSERNHFWRGGGRRAGARGTFGERRERKRVDNENDNKTMRVTALGCIVCWYDERRNPTIVYTTNENGYSMG